MINYPPLTGGMSATSSPSVTTAASSAYSAFTAMSERPTSGAKAGHAAASAYRTSATVAPQHRSTAHSAAPASSRPAANIRTATLILLLGYRRGDSASRVAQASGGTPKQAISPGE